MRPSCQDNSFISLHYPYHECPLCYLFYLALLDPSALQIQARVRFPSGETNLMRRTFAALTLVEILVLVVILVLAAAIGAYILFEEQRRARVA